MMNRIIVIVAVMVSVVIINGCGMSEEKAVRIGRTRLQEYCAKSKIDFNKYQLKSTHHDKNYETWFLNYQCKTNCHEEKIELFGVLVHRNGTVELSMMNYAKYL